jgi:hypothetical protein
VSDTLGRLVRIKPGVWFRPHAVTRVAAFGPQELGKTTIPAHTIVSSEAGAEIRWDCKDYNEAVKLADEIGRRLNGDQR